MSVAICFCYYSDIIWFSIWIYFWCLIGICGGVILWKLRELNVSVHCGSLCERDILLVRDREEDMETDMCFFRRLQRHNTTTSFFTTHTHSQTQTLSHTHMSGQPWLAGQVVPEEFFFRVLQIFLDHKWSPRIFWTARGSRNI